MRKRSSHNFYFYLFVVISSVYLPWMVNVERKEWFPQIYVSDKKNRSIMVGSRGSTPIPNKPKRGRGTTTPTRSPHSSTSSFLLNEENQRVREQFYGPDLSFWTRLPSNKWREPESERLRRLPWLMAGKTEETLTLTQPHTTTLVEKRNRVTGLTLSPPFYKSNGRGGLISLEVSLGSSLQSENWD